MNRRILLLASAATALSVGSNCGSAWAQSVSVPDPALSKSDSGLQDIIVTAERRSTDVQHVAGAITAIGGADLSQRGVVNAVGLVNSVPGLGISINSPTVNIYVRGVGGGISNSYGDPTVAYNVDGVYLARPFGGPNGTYFDLDRVEILKGPQGTLYGRNATVGAVNVIAKRPVQKTEGDVGLGFGNYGTVDTSGMVNVPITDQLAIRLAFKTYEHDGYLTNGYNDAHSTAVRGSVLYKPSTNWSALLSAEYFRDTSKGPQSVFIYYNNDQQRFLNNNPWYGIATPPCAAPNICPLLPSTFSPSPPPLVGQDGFVDSQQVITKAEITGDFGFASLTLLPAYVRTDASHRGYTGGFIFNYDYKIDQYSGELRLASNGTGPLKWLVGTFGYFESQNANQSFYMANGNLSWVTPHQNDTSYAIFGQATYALTSSLRLTGGLRYTTERKTEDGYVDEPGVSAPVCGIVRGTVLPGPENPHLCRIQQAGRLTFHATNFKAGVEFDAGARSLVYANISTGFKAGGFFLGTAPNTYKPEKLTAYQIGSKNRFLDNRLQVNLEGFYWDYQDQQVYAFQNINPVGFSTYPVNAQGWLAGGEMDATFLVTPDDRLTADVLFEKGKFTNYTTPGAFIQASPTFKIILSPAGTFTNVSRPNLPEWSITAGYEHSFHLPSGGDIVASAHTHFESSAWMDITKRPGSLRGAYANSDLQLGYYSPANRWSLVGYVNNVTNVAVTTAGSSAAFVKSVTFVPPNANAWAVGILPPRTFGARINYHF